MKTKSTVEWFFRRFGSSRTNPRDVSILDVIDLAASDLLLNAEQKSAHWKRIDCAEDAVRMHRGSQSLGRHSVPHANFHEAPTAHGVSCQTVALGIGRLRRGLREAEAPGDVVSEHPHGFSATTSE